MENKIRIGIVGYGNIGKAVEAAVQKNPDMSLEAIFTRRDHTNFKINSKASIAHVNNAKAFTNSIDVALLCGGSATDLPVQGPKFASLFNTVDSYDTHAKIPQYFASINQAAFEAGKTAVISTGWDPGTLSLERLFASSFLNLEKAYAFYGLTEKGGLSMGHSDAIRRVEGVEDAKQYTHAIPQAIERIRAGENPDLSLGDMHWRECIVVAKEGADKKKIEEEIVKMPNYFEPYKTIVRFVDKETLLKDHTGMPHDGLLIAVTETTPGNKGLIEYKCQWDNNPQATAQIMLAYARAVHKLNKEGNTGAKTVFDIAPKYLSAKRNEELRKQVL